MSRLIEMPASARAVVPASIDGLVRLDHPRHGAIVRAASATGAPERS